MTSKEALENIKEYLLEKLKEDGSELGFLIIKENVDVLEDLVERDTPMLPIKLKWNNTENYYYVCPKCEELVARTDEVFCQDCGQRLDWNFDFLETLKEEQKERNNETKRIPNIR